jgi:hypothetical protein
MRRPVPEPRSVPARGLPGRPLAGAAGAIFNQTASVIGHEVPEFRAILRCGAFDLAGLRRSKMRDSRLVGHIQGRNVSLCAIHLSARSWYPYAIRAPEARNGVEA